MQHIKMDIASVHLLGQDFLQHVLYLPSVGHPTRLLLAILFQVAGAGDAALQVVFNAAAATTLSLDM